MKVTKHDGENGIQFDLHPPTIFELKDAGRKKTVDELRDLLIQLDSRIHWSQGKRRKLNPSGTRPPFVRVFFSASNITDITERPTEHLREIAKEVIDSVAVSGIYDIQKRSRQVMDDISSLKQINAVIGGSKVGNFFPKAASQQARRA